MFTNTSIVIIDCASKTHRLANISECFKVHLVSLESWNSSWFGYYLALSEQSCILLFMNHTQRKRRISGHVAFSLKSLYHSIQVLVSFFILFYFFFLGYVNKREQLFSSLFVHVKYCTRWHTWNFFSQLRSNVPSVSLQASCVTSASSLVGWCVRKSLDSV